MDKSVEKREKNEHNISCRKKSEFRSNEQSPFTQQGDVLEIKGFVKPNTVIAARVELLIIWVMRHL